MNWMAFLPPDRAGTTVQWCQKCRRYFVTCEEKSQLIPGQDSVFAVLFDARLQTFTDCLGRNLEPVFILVSINQ